MAAGLMLMPIAALASMGAPTHDPKTGRLQVPDPPLWLVFGPFVLLFASGALMLIAPVHLRRLTSRAASGAPPMPATTTPCHSPDRAWWYDGSAWRPAFTADRGLWFDGTQWVPAAPRRRRDTDVAAVIVLVAALVLSPLPMALFVDGTPSLGTVHRVLTHPALWLNESSLLALTGVALLVAGRLKRRSRPLARRRAE